MTRALKRTKFLKVGWAPEGFFLWGEKKFVGNEKKMKLGFLATQQKRMRCFWWKREVHLIGALLILKFILHLPCEIFGVTVDDYNRYLGNQTYLFWSFTTFGRIEKKVSTLAIWKFSPCAKNNNCRYFGEIFQRHKKNEGTTWLT